MKLKDLMKKIEAANFIAEEAGIDERRFCVYVDIDGCSVSDVGCEDYKHEIFFKRWVNLSASIASDYTTEVCELFTHDLLRVDEGVYVIENEICEIKVVVCYRRNW